MIVPGAGFMIWPAVFSGNCYGCSNDYSFNDTVWDAGPGVTWDTDHFVAPFGTSLEITTASPQCQDELGKPLQIVVEAINPSLGGGAAYLQINVVDVDTDTVLESVADPGLVWDGTQTTFTLDASFPYVTTGKLKIVVNVVGFMATWDYLHITAVTLNCAWVP